MKGILLLIAMFTGLLAFSQNGAITGTVKDALGETVPGVTVELIGKNKVTQTDFDGIYTFSDLIPGVYSIRLSYVEFQTQVITDISVGTETVYTDVIMSLPVADSAVKKIEEFVVSARQNTGNTGALMSEQKNSAQVSDGVSAQTLRNMPVKSTADALKVVSGAAIQDNKFAVIRGLNDRYNAAYLNGGALPSSESDRKAFSFDIFPANMLDKLVIIKTATPDQPAEFAGGVIQITTKGIPEKKFLTVQGSGGYNTITTFKSRTSSAASGKLDWLGVDDGTRKLPSAMPGQEEFPNNIHDQAKLAKEVPSNWGLKTGTFSPNFSAQVSAGNSFKVFGKDLGVIGALTYNRSYSYTETIRKGYTFGANSTEAILDFDYLDHNNVTSTLAGALANFTLRLNPRNDISFKNIYSINSDDKLISRTGSVTPLESNQTLLKSNVAWMTQNNIYSGQISGDHLLRSEKLRINWLASYSNIFRNVPSLNRSTYTRKDHLEAENPNFRDTMWIASISNSSVGPSYGGGMFFSTNRESSSSVRTDLTYSLGRNRFKTDVKVGGFAQQRERNFTARQFGYTRYGIPGGNVKFDNNLLYLPENEIFNPENMGIITPAQNGNPAIGGFKLTEGTKPSDSYSAKSTLTAAYAMADHKLGSRDVENTGRSLRFIYGLRYELFNQRLMAKKADNTDLELNTLKGDLLPSANFIFSMNKTQNVRLSYSQTLNRPEYRELAPFAFYDFATNFVVSGNDTLQRCKIHNADLRYEVYPGRGQIFSATLFYKNFQNPIEQISRADVASEITYRNVPSAINYGLEVEFRTLIGSLFNTDTSSFLQNFTVFSNLAVIRSMVDVSDVVGATTSTRPLQGQSPYVFNAGLNYINKRFDWTISMNMNRVGSRIAIVGNVMEPDLWEQSRTFLDLQITKGFWKKRAEFKLSVQNLLAQDQVYYQNVETESSARGSSFKRMTNTVFTGDKNNADGYQKGTDNMIWSTGFGPTISAGITLKF